jgi:hypothetical protein
LARLVARYRALPRQPAPLLGCSALGLLAFQVAQVGAHWRGLLVCSLQVPAFGLQVPAFPHLLERRRIRAYYSLMAHQIENPHWQPDQVSPYLYQLQVFQARVDQYRATAEYFSDLGKMILANQTQLCGRPLAELANGLVAPHCPELDSISIPDVNPPTLD